MRAAVLLLAAVASVTWLLFPADPSAPAVRTNPVDGSEMVLVPAGRFAMGSDQGPPIVRPAHRPYVRSFWIGRHEVTNRQFARFVREARPELQESSPPWLYFATAGREDHPVVQVSLEDAAAYCWWAGGRLPTEAEWEKAARGTDGREYPWGNEWDPERLDWGGSGREDTAPVGSFPAGASPYGALDMAGNVAEWVEGRYQPYQWGVEELDYLDDDPSASPEENPPIDWGLSENQVVRGGAWTDLRPACATWMRHWKLAFAGSTTTGFRLVLDPATFPESPAPRRGAPPDRDTGPEP